MDKNLAKKNIRAGPIISAQGFVLFGFSFVAAAPYLA